MGQSCHSKLSSDLEDVINKFTLEAFGLKVEDFSSQYARENSVSYAVKNLAGERSIYPRYGDFTQACVLRTYGVWWRCTIAAAKSFIRPEPDDFVSHDFVDISYEVPVYPDSVKVYETYHPGAVVRILAYCIKPEVDDEEKDRKPTCRWVTLWSGQPQIAAREARIFSPPLTRVYFPTSMLRLEFNATLCRYYPELDAVQLIGFRVNDTTQCLMSAAAAPRPVVCNDEDAELESLNDAIYKMDLDDTADPEGYFSHILGEIIEKIFSYLDLRSLCKAAATCTLFRRYAYDSLQYREVNLQPFWSRVDNNTLDVLRQRCDHLRKLNLSWCGNYGLISPNNFESFVRSTCCQLTVLSLGCCKVINEDCLSVIANTCTKLTDLDLQSCRSIGSYGFIHLAKMGLRRLNLYRTIIETGTLIGIIKTNPQLEYLNVGSCINLIQDDVAKALATSTSSLRSLDLWRAQALSDVGVNALAEGCPLLEEIDLGWCPDVRSESNCINRLVTRCVRLKKIIFTANRTVCDDDLEAIARYCPLLEQLDILGTSQVSAQSAQRVLDNCKYLKMFDVSFCTRISFGMYHTWLKTYPHVDIKKSFIDT